MAKRKPTAKQKAFIKEYQKDLNASAAAKRAGYSENYAGETGYQLLQKNTIKPQIEKDLREKLEKADITTQRILRELCYIAFSDISDVMSWTDTGVAFIDSNKLDESFTKAISEVSETVTDAGGTRKLKMHDKLKALDMLGKYLEMWGGEGKKKDEPIDVSPHRNLIDRLKDDK